MRRILPYGVYLEIEDKPVEGAASHESMVHADSASRRISPLAVDYRFGQAGYVQMKF